MAGTHSNSWMEKFQIFAALKKGVNGNTGAYDWREMYGRCKQTSV